MNIYSKADVWLRGLLYVFIAGIGFLINDETFRSSVAPLTLSYLGAASAILLAIRAYIDISAAGNKKNPTPVEVTNTDKDPVPVEAKDNVAG